MISQTKTGLNSRSEAIINEYDLPLITAPMYGVVDGDTIRKYQELGIKVCTPRGIHSNESVFTSYSLDEFIDSFCNKDAQHSPQVKVCIDTANGNMRKLHQAICVAKEIHGDNLIIMAGNVGSGEAFLELAKTGVDYIRVGIGGGNGCTTTVHTGVGQECLLQLIRSCVFYRNTTIDTAGYRWLHQQTDKEKQKDLNVSKVKIVADGISSYIRKENLHENGYAAINQLLYAGADLVMIGSIFNRAFDSPAKKVIKLADNEYHDISRLWSGELTWIGYDPNQLLDLIDDGYVYTSYEGMSTQDSQRQYKSNGVVKHSEGRKIEQRVDYTLNEWLNGSTKKPNEYPGFINCLKSAMAYTGSRTLEEFRQ